MSGGTEVSAPDPWWTWPSRVVGALLIVVGLVGPVAWLYRRSVAEVPRQRVLAAPSVPKQSERPMLRPKMLHLPPGDFRMGSTESTGEEPVRIVHLTRAFALSETEVTQAQYHAVMRNNPSRNQHEPDSGQHPVEQVSWLDAVKYCNRLSKLEGRTPCYKIQGEQGKQVEWPDAACLGYRLPTEAEWEYAARADQTYQYAGSDELDRVAWHAGNASNTTHPVAQKDPNAWFLYDMSGSVWEWVWDRFHYSYRGAETQDPRGPSISDSFVRRGGSFFDEAFNARVSARNGYAPSIHVDFLGFRLARSLP